MFRYVQAANPSDVVDREVAEIIARGKTKFQEYVFFRSPVHGVCIALDDDIQSCESDEGIYHEALVHPALLLHPKPERVLIMGGGEGATAREVLRHPHAKDVVMVDIDREFVELCREHIPSWSDGVWRDSRLSVRYEDINAYLEASGEPFDVVIGDLVDVHDWDSPVASLYGAEFYQRLKARLSSDAIIATQGGALSPVDLAGHNHIRATFNGVFEHVVSYGLVVPSFYHLWGYVVASDASFLSDMAAIRREISSADTRLNFTLNHTGGDALASAFALPTAIADKLR